MSWLRRAAALHMLMGSTTLRLRHPRGLGIHRLLQHVFIEHALGLHIILQALRDKNPLLYPRSPPALMPPRALLRSRIPSSIRRATRDQDGILSCLYYCYYRCHYLYYNPLDSREHVTIVV